MLKTIGNKYKFEIVIGFNGKIWVKAGDYVTTIIIANTIQKALLPKSEFEMVLSRIKNL